MLPYTHLNRVERDTHTHIHRQLVVFLMSTHYEDVKHIDEYTLFKLATNGNRN